MSRRNQLSVVNNSEPETARRRRDSLDRSLASFEPPKTTVKRMLLQEDHQKVSVNRSSLLMDKQHFNPPMLEGSVATHPKHFTISSTLYPSENKGIQDTSIKQASESPSTLFRWADDLPGSSHSIGLKSAMQMLPRNSFSASSTQSASQSSPIVGQSSARGSCDQTALRSGNGITITEKSDSLSINESLSIQQSEIHLRQAPSVSVRLPMHILSSPKKSSEMSKSNDKEIGFSNFNVGSVKHRAVTTGSSFVESGRSREYPFSPVSAVGPASIPTAKVFQSETPTSESQPGETISSSSTSSLSILSPSSSPMINSSAAPQSLPIPLTAPISSSPVSLGRLSTGSKATVDANPTVSISKSSVSSFPNLSSSSSFQITEKLVPSSTPFMNLTSEPPKTKPQPPMAKLNSKTDQNFIIQTSAPQPEPPNGTFSSKLESSVPSTLTSEPKTNLQSGSQLSFNGLSNPAPNDGLNSEPEQPLAAHVLSSAAFSTSGSATGGKYESSSIAVTQEDEMEEEAPEASNTTEFTLGNLGGFGIGSTPDPTATKPNPFGVPFSNAAASPMSSPFSMTVSNGELFRPASFSFQSPSQPSQLTNFGAFSGGFSTGTTAQISTGSSFGQPAPIGSGQQVLGSVLGTFGQSRQLGVGLPGSAVSAGGFGGAFVGTQSSGGFLNASTGGFAGIASTGGGFTNLASTGGGFGGGGGFSASGSGFPAGGGFGGFSNQQGIGGFSAFATLSVKQANFGKDSLGKEQLPANLQQGLMWWCNANKAAWRRLKPKKDCQRHDGRSSKDAIEVLEAKMEMEEENKAPKADDPMVDPPTTDLLGIATHVLEKDPAPTEQ
ncbi:hypothetical protein F0562_002620 [Nyssa sinensis]|uniref:Uncharacterized protein n=1 Tax=Nyssa sinensis TaxID=561372 RepID=A0A5J5C7F5_9ASTE|nr:hypothetical protein F0562_002620 [Nyssa sinensis]